MFYFERKFRRQGFQYIIGVDEVGRGPLAGPVVAGAVLLKTKRFRNRIVDSKALSRWQREKAFYEIIEKSLFGIGVINEKVIDRLNILEATRLAMENAIWGILYQLKKNRRYQPVIKDKVFVLVDGNVRLDIGYPYQNIIRGDQSSRSIAAASIVAKVTRDRIMDLYAQVYPQYGFFRNKGYPTAFHRQALTKHGPSLIHRQSFLKWLNQN